MEVLDKVKVIGRGYVFVVVPDQPINVGDYVFAGINAFKVTSVEHLSHMEKVGLILAPNKAAGELIEVGDTILIA